MTAAELADLNGLLALLAADRAKRGDRRDKSLLVDDILTDARAPDIKPLLWHLTSALSATKALALVVLIAAICAPLPPSDEACHFGPPFTYCDAASAGAGE